MLSLLNLTSLPTTRIVLQGEFAIVDGSTSQETIKTVHAYTCTVFSLYNPDSKIAVLGHFDDYTDVTASLDRIATILKERFGEELNQKYYAKLVDRSECGVVASYFKKRGISIWKLNLEKFGSFRPHLSIRPQDGVNIIIEDTNYPLEYLQRREYAKFVNRLERKYPGVDSLDLPYFPAREACRHEEKVAKFPKNVNSMKKAKEWGSYLESLSKDWFPIQAERSAKAE